MSTKPANPIMGAVRDLRLALGDTQQSFAQRLGLSISTVVRYELTRPPKGTALAQLMQVASENNQPDIAMVFAGALADELGYREPREVIVSSLHRFVEVTIKPEEKPDFEALLTILRNPGLLSGELAAWKKLRDRVNARAGAK